jgi:hypothetical protein
MGAATTHYLVAAPIKARRIGVNSEMRPFPKGAPIGD